MIVEGMEWTEPVKHLVTFDVGPVPSVTMYSCWCNRCQRVIWCSDKPEVPRYVYEHKCPTGSAGSYQ